MSVRMISRKYKPAPVSIKLIDGSLIQGQINLYGEEFKATRVSDLFTIREDPFVVLSRATVEGKTNQIVVINKRNIIWVSPEETPKKNSL